MAITNSFSTMHRSVYTSIEVEQEDIPAIVLDDETLIRKAFEVSPEVGCEYLFRKYHKPLCNHALRFVFSKEKAEDIVSDVFCKFWKNGSYLSVNSSFRYYLFRSVRNEAYTQLRTEFTQQSHMDFTSYQDLMKVVQPDEITQYEETYNRVQELVDQLPPQCRKIFLMNRFEGKRYKEIALELGLSTKTIESHISKGLGMIRKGMADYWVCLLWVFNLGL
ncbi:RNA polymerase sigma-70 factor (ECF subfamily) [Dyadobacter jejuensis]|uniref:RNA polymerase sigma-70 factor (ECF subfamily) n=1 Tax=Dyadobacter jejuensis TaxID=1082580 RepID=A0A316ALJ0_9BACT|nr:RNA polymerase sigma-70 factor [Dyadobacter jejuensis]PWJ58446.1 RNA polymerase sigma-70 factor (ECF subfamily) [Dyadobacter jejuensis]